MAERMHTPGEWLVDHKARLGGSPADGRVAMTIRSKAWDHSDLMGDYRGNIICSLEESHGERFHAFDETNANARLIASAPELLDNLKDMVRRFEGCLITNGTDKEFAQSATAHARAAIQKAEGAA